MARRYRRKKNHGDPLTAGVGLILLAGLAINAKATIGLAALLIIAGTSLWLMRAATQRKPTQGSAQGADNQGSSGSLQATPGDPTVEAEWTQRRAPTCDPLPTEWSTKLLFQVDWKLIEDLTAAYFRAKGWDASVTGNGADDGVDIALRRSNSGQALIGVVQCKAWKEQLVGVSQIRELLGTMTHFSAPLGVFITLKGYTEQARAFAKGKHIQLIDAERLIKLIKGLDPITQKSLLEQITNGDFRVPSCPSCGTKLVKRSSRSSNRTFWGCTNFPNCRFVLNGHQP